MSKFEVKVIGAKPPKRPEELLARLRRRIGGVLKLILLRPKLIILPAIAGFLLFVGTPHAGLRLAISRGEKDELQKQFKEVDRQIESLLDR